MKLLGVHLQSLQLSDIACLNSSEGFLALVYIRWRRRRIKCSRPLCNSGGSPYTVASVLIMKNITLS